MSRTSRKPGPINLQTTQKQYRQYIGQSEWISIDVNDGSWQANDPNSTLVSCSTSSSGMTIALESDRDSDTWSSAAQTCARWFKPLTTPSGSLMKWEDEFGVEFLVQRVSTNANDENMFVACLSDDPTDTSNQAWAGLRMTNDSDGDLELQYGGDQDLVKITGDSGDLGSSPRGYVNCMLQIADDRSSDAIEPIGVAGVLLDNDNDVIGGNMGNNGQNVSWNNSNNVYLVVAAGWTASGASSDSSAVWKAWYRLTHSFAKLDPMYVPGGGKNPRGGVLGQQA
jgi:hypothetical protein